MRNSRADNGGLTVGLVHWALPPTIGGVESHLADYIRLLTGRGVRVVVFTGERKTAVELCQQAVIEYNPLLHLAGRGVLPDDGEECISNLREWFENLLLYYQVDVIHGHNLHYFSSAPVSALNLVCNNLSIDRHHTYHNYWGDDSNFAHLVSGWEGQWANSGFLARRCAEGYGIRPLTRYMGIDPGRFNCERLPFEGRDPRAKAPEDTPVILQPARLLRWKGPIESVKMLHHLHQARYRVRLILTDTPTLIDWDDERKALRAELAELIDMYGLNDWVKFENQTFCSDMPRLYADADIVINPSHGEPLGLVALEAMAASRPIVATDSGGMKETATKRTGAIVPDDQNLDLHLFEAVQSFLRHPSRAVRAGHRGRRHVVKNFHMNTYIDSMLDQYRASQRRSHRSDYDGALMEMTLLAM